MDTEFHYYLTGIIAKAAGFTEDEAKIIASASEFVDENDTQITVQDRAGGDPYENYISQTMNILKPKRSLMRVYPVFHFIPGDPTADTACRSDGKMHLLNTTPNGAIANELMDEAFKATEDTRLYRIGIATHAYADTWAHQNFVGWYDYFNDIGLDPKPDIGHADAEHHPDWPAHRWEDSRLVQPVISNTQRFLDASENIFKKYRDYTTKVLKRTCPMTWPKLQVNLAILMGPSFSGSRNYYEEDRLARYRAVAPWLGDFDEMAWVDAAIKTKVRGLKDPGEGLTAMITLFRDEYFWREDRDSETTDWYRFQEAVKEHQVLAMAHLEPLFKKMGIDLRAH